MLLISNIMSRQEVSMNCDVAIPKFIQQSSLCNGTFWLFDTILCKTNPDYHMLLLLSAYIILQYQSLYYTKEGYICKVELHFRSIFYPRYILVLTSHTSDNVHHTQTWRMRQHWNPSQSDGHLSERPGDDNRLLRLNQKIKRVPYLQACLCDVDYFDRWDMYSCSASVIDQVLFRWTQVAYSNGCGIFPLLLSIFASKVKLLTFYIFDF